MTRGTCSAPNQHNFVALIFEALCVSVKVKIHWIFNISSSNNTRYVYFCISRELRVLEVHINGLATQKEGRRTRWFGFSFPFVQNSSSFKKLKLKKNRCKQGTTKIKEMWQMKKKRNKRNKSKKVEQVSAEVVTRRNSASSTTEECHRPTHRATVTAETNIISILHTSNKGQNILVSLSFSLVFCSAKDWWIRSVSEKSWQVVALQSHSTKNFHKVWGGKFGSDDRRWVAALVRCLQPE